MTETTEDDDAGTPPPRGVLATARHLGPGLIIAGAIVGSGELIMTTKTGAQSGISLLWLIVVGCVIKVFVQVELGRYAVTNRQTTLEALDSLPGPRLRVHPVLWLWAAMMLATMLQLGGIVGGVGQAMAIAVPLTGDYRESLLIPGTSELSFYLDNRDAEQTDSEAWQSRTPAEREKLRRRVAYTEDRLRRAGLRGEDAVRSLQQTGEVVDPPTRDDKYWAMAAALLTMMLLSGGRYSLVQNVSTVLVTLFTVATLVNVFGLQATDEYRVTLSEILSGLAFSLPDTPGAVGTALATFGLIGVGATELIAYPYWCLEKGYGRHTGPTDDSPEWAARASGWLRVMRIDAFVSMAVYTTATLAFFLIGVAVLHDAGLDPDGTRMISTLAEAYLPVFGKTAEWVFLIGAVAVLYSTFLIAIAAQTRIYTDALAIFGLLDGEDERVRRRSISSLAVVLPTLFLGFYWVGLNPVQGVIASGVMQGLMQPVLAVTAVYFRYCRTRPGLTPGVVWDVFLWVSVAGMVLAGAWGIFVKVRDVVGG